MTQPAEQQDLLKRIREGEKLISEVWQEFASHRYIEAGVPATDGSQDTGWMRRAQEYLSAQPAAAKESAPWPLVVDEPFV